MDQKQRFQARVEDISMRAQQMRELCVNSQFDKANGAYIDDPAARLAAIDGVAATMPMFESLTEGHRREVVSAMASSVVEYEKQFGELPRDEVFAAAHKAMENMLILEGANKTGNEGQMMMESIGSSLSESSGVEIRAKMVGLILPTMLATATSDAVTYIPGANDEVEIFKVRRVAGSNFGDLKRGEEIDSTTVGQYSQMRQRYKFPAAQQPDGTKTEFAFKAKTDLSMGIDIPVKKGTAAIYYNRRRVATDFDQKNGRLYGEVPQTDGTMISISGTVDYTNCSIVVTPATALPAGELHVMFEIDIEASPELIPTIDHDMTSCKLRPSQAAIAADATIQAMFAMNREYGIDLKSMQMSHLRNFLANEKAVRHLTDIDFACVNESTFNLYCPADADWKLHRELLRQTLLNISTNILELTKTVGLIGMFAGRQACTVLKSMGPDFFQPAAGYQQTNNIHFAGTLFGMWKVYEAPIVIGEWDVLCYGRGASHSDAGYVAGDAIPATMYNHPIGTNLRSRNTLWELAYGEVHPFDGANYFHRLHLVDVAPTK